MAGREYHEVRKRLGIEPADSSPYILYARKLLGELKEDMAFNKLQQGVRRRLVDGGRVKIEVTSLFGQDEIHITVPVEPPNPPRKKRVKEDVILRWVFCTPAAYGSYVTGPTATGAVYIHDVPASEPRLVAEFSSFGVGTEQINFLGWFDWKRRNLAVAYYTDYDQVGCAYIDPLSGAALFAKSFPGTDWVSGACSYDGVVYLLHGMTATIRIVTKDADEAIDISGTFDWATWMFISSDGKYLVLCAGEFDIAPPYRVEVFDIEKRQFVGSPFLREWRTDDNTLFFEWDQESDALYVFHSNGLEAGTPATMTRVDLVDGVLTERYEAGMMSGRVFGASADKVAVHASSKAGLVSNDPGVVQFMDPETGALVHLYVDPESVGSNWPVNLCSDTRGTVYSWSTPYDDDDYRMTRIKAGELKWASHGDFIPITYGESLPLDTDDSER